MPRYYFNVRQGRQTFEDKEGNDLHDLAAAELEARLTARDLAIEHLKAGNPVDGREIDIIDEHGEVLTSIQVRSVLDVPR